MSVCICFGLRYPSSLSATATAVATAHCCRNRTCELLSVSSVPSQPLLGMWVFAAAICLVLFAAYTFLSNKKRASAEAADPVSVSSSSSSSSASGKGGGAAKAKPRISFYFGSQTGTAEGFASELAENGDEDMFDIRTVDMEDVDPEEDLAGDAVSVFIVAT